MCKRTAFIGHRHVYDENLGNGLYQAIEKEIENGCKCFTMGTHGDFDRQALSVCRQLRQKYGDIKIEVVITSFAQIKPVDCMKPYDDVETMMYEIEETHFKKKITESNKQMIDTCDTLICYVDENYKYASGALTALKSAKKKGLQIVNLFHRD